MLEKAPLDPAVFGGLQTRFYRTSSGEQVVELEQCGLECGEVRRLCIGCCIFALSLHMATLTPLAATDAHPTLLRWQERDTKLYPDACDPSCMYAKATKCPALRQHRELCPFIAGGQCAVTLSCLYL
jgi:hypothetical protein